MRRSLTSNQFSVSLSQVCGSLISICRLVNNEMIPALIQPVIVCLAHQNEAVRKKAIMSLHKFYKLDPASVTSCKDAIRKVLCDQDPSVMGASLHMLADMAKASATRAHCLLVFAPFIVQS